MSEAKQFLVFERFEEGNGFGFNEGFNEKGEVFGDSLVPGFGWKGCGNLHLSVSVYIKLSSHPRGLADATSLQCFDV